MSADYYIYTDHIDEFDRRDFEHWAAELGYELELHPQFSIRDEGFAPVRFRAEFLGEGSWQTGLELFSFENEPAAPNPAPVLPAIPKKQGFFARLFGKKKPAVRSPEEILSMPIDIPDHAGSEKKWVITCACRFHDPLEQLVCYLFAGYFCERFGAVLDDPQTGRFFESPEDIRQEFQPIVDEMMACYRDWGLAFIPFTGWDDGN